jgi:hypothetical protein
MEMIFEDEVGKLSNGEGFGEEQGLFGGVDEV